MKKLLLSTALIALAAFAAQADDAKPKAAAPAGHSCCSKAKTEQTSASCPMAQDACCSGMKQTAARKTLVKQALLSPKAAAAL